MRNKRYYVQINGPHYRITDDISLKTWPQEMIAFDSYEAAMDYIEAEVNKAYPDAFYMHSIMRKAMDRESFIDYCDEKISEFKYKFDELLSNITSGFEFLFRVFTYPLTLFISLIITYEEK
jgi:hypothetical protein